MCGIFGIANHSDASRLTYLGLYALQHRGQESTGISSSDGDQVYTHKSMGHVADVYDEERSPGSKASMPSATRDTPPPATAAQATRSPSW